MYFTDKKQFALRTAADVYPTVSMDFPLLMNFYQKNQEFCDNKPSEKIKGAKLMGTENTPVFYEFHPNGEYRNFHDMAKEMKRRYQRLKVFSDRFPTSSESANK